jgi:hypothetical protein
MLSLAGPVAAQPVHPVLRQIKVVGPLGDLKVGQDTADVRHAARRKPPRTVPGETCRELLST